MKKTTFLSLAFMLAMAPGMVLAELVEALNFTNNASAWTTTVLDPGTPDPYPHTLELDGDPTKVGYTNNVTSTAAVRLLQEVNAPPDFIMSDVTLDAKVSGFSGHIHLGRIGLGTFEPAGVASMNYWTGVSQLGGSHTNTPVTLDASADGAFMGITSVWVGVEVHKGIAGTYVQPDVSMIELHATLTSTIPGPDPVDFARIDANDVIGLSFTGAVDELYLLQSTTNLVSTDWFDTDLFIRGTGGESFVYDPAGISTQKNYRIVEALP